MKKARIVLSEDASCAYSEINRLASSSKQYASLLKSVNNKVALIKDNPHYGSPIAKSLIPRVYEKQFGVTNLFRVELSNFWRMEYTLKNHESEIEIIAFVLDIVDHSKYNELLGYKKN